MEIQRNDNRQFNLPTLPAIQCNADLHLNLINADWFGMSKGSSI